MAIASAKITATQGIVKFQFSLPSKPIDIETNGSVKIVNLTESNRESNLAINGNIHNLEITYND